MSGAYYNEIDKYAAQWLRNLIAAGHIAPGDVDERSITEVQSDDLRGYTQCHFFSGIGGWSLALRLAGVADTAAVWTGSPPCQDNSVAAAVHGRRTGLDGPRSGLARKWLSLVDAIRPPAVTFENVPGVAPWLAEIAGRLARSGYRVSRSKRSSASVGAAHLRRRVWLLAERHGARLPITGRPEPSAPTCDPRATAPRGTWVASQRGFRPVDDGLPERVGGVHAAGNAIDPWAAAAALRDMTEAAA
jgi:DNA (cytosine-5)-methyltransferase 1